MHTTHLGDLRVEARRENLRTITYFIQAIGQRLNLSEQTQFDIELAVEEAATNIINHAYLPDQEGLMQIQADLLGDTLRISLTDWGIPFDASKVKPFDIHAPIETRINGGMGLHFIHNMMDVVERQTARNHGEPNHLHLFKHIEASAPSRGARMRAAQDLNALQTISEVMTTDISLDELLGLIVTKLVNTIEAERGTLYLIDETTGECVSRVLLEDEQVLSEIRLKIGEGIAGHVAKTGETLNISDAHAHPLFNAEFDRKTGYYTRNILALPMRDPKGRIIGVVQLLNKIGGSFSGPDARLLSAMASQAAISIENARLYEQEFHQRFIQKELQTAQDIQTSFLPEKVPHLAGWDIGAFWQPVQNVAGDFYDFYPLEDGRLAVVIADVSGKGIPAALFMALSVTVMRFGMSLGLSPYDMILRANDLILQQQRSRMFATIFVAYIDPISGQMEYVSAGHNPPLLYRAKTGACEVVTGRGVAVGVFGGAVYESKSLEIQAHDVLVLYTDGITEAMNAQDDEFGDERLEALICAAAHQPAQAICEAIIQAIHSFADGRPSFDDETLIVIKRLD